jgi:hypothetical protein
VSDLLVALAGGVIGSVATAVGTQAGRFRVAWAEVGLHDDQARERNAELVVWVDVETQKLVAQMNDVTIDYNGRNLLNSGAHGSALVKVKANALRRYSDEERRARLDLARLRASEGTWHLVIRKRRHRPAPTLTARETVEPFLDRWRGPVTLHGTGAAEVRDWTTRTTDDALVELPTLPLT